MSTVDYFRVILGLYFVNGFRVVRTFVVILLVELFEMAVLLALVLESIF